MTDTHAAMTRRAYYRRVWPAYLVGVANAGLMLWAMYRADAAGLGMPSYLAYPLILSVTVWVLVVYHFLRKRAFAATLPGDIARPAFPLAVLPIAGCVAASPGLNGLAEASRMTWHVVLILIVACAAWPASDIGSTIDKLRRRAKADERALAKSA